MSPTSSISKWEAWSGPLRSLLRIVAAFLFFQAGAVKVFGFPAGKPMPFGTEAWIAGILEVVGGGLLILGLFTRPVAFLLAGEMAVAYFQFHFPKGFWPVVNGGVPAILYCFIWLYFSAAGPGPWSVDAARGRRRGLL